MSARLGYVKTDEVKLVRRKHRVGFQLGSSASYVAALLARVPADAVVIDVIDYGEFDDHNVTTIEFAEETTN